MSKQGFQEAEKITRLNARTFYLASFFLSSDKRLAAYTIYAICQLSDASVDDIELSDAQKKEGLNSVRAKIDQAFSATQIKDPLVLSFQKTVENYHIPKEYFDELIDGMAMDLTMNRYQNFNELYTYSYKVAGVIGLIMLKIFGCKDANAPKYAIDLGIALQLTNILRDIKEDFARGRIYLPEDEMKKFGISEEDIERQLADERFQSFMRFQAKRARDYFFRASQGIELIEDNRCRFVAFLILELYAKILKKIEKNNFDVYNKLAFIPAVEKIFSVFYLFYRFLRKSFTFQL